MKSMVIISFALLFQAFALGAGVTPAAASSISVEIDSTSYVTVSEARAVQADNRLKISGIITRLGEVHLPGHVDLLLLAADGSLLEKRRISVPGLQSNRKGRMGIRFGTALDLSVPAGSRAILRYHAPGELRKNC